jgi:hypothetical protein
MHLRITQFPVMLSTAQPVVPVFTLYSQSCVEEQDSMQRLVFQSHKHRGAIQSSRCSAQVPRRLP